VAYSFQVRLFVTVSKGLRDELRQSFCTTDAHLKLNVTIGLARKARTSIEANQANILAHRVPLGDGAGLSALDSRLEAVNLSLAQIRADLNYCRPVSQAASYVRELHQTQLMTIQSLAETEANKSRHWENLRLTYLLIWIGGMQLVAAPDFLPNWLRAPAPLVVTFAAIGGLVIRRFTGGKHGAHPAPPVDGGLRTAEVDGRAKGTQARHSQGPRRVHTEDTRA
jgi:hypothetical protein